MSIPEVLWRLSQKNIQRQEEKRFSGSRIDVTSEVFNEKLGSLTAHTEKLHINFENSSFALNTAIHLLSGADYKEYKNRWNAGFQTENTWPDTFSYKLDYKQRDDIGDARTNWELNRHFQFALLAKNYAASGNQKYLNELESLFKDWNDKNPFLHGISWTSVDVTGIDAIPGDEVVLIDDRNYTADDMAESIGTIGYEVVCNISNRVPREYI